jgi:signal transduction histidine kinase
LPVAVRRRWPAGALWAALSGSAAMVLVGIQADSLVALVLIMFTAALTLPSRQARALLAEVLATLTFAVAASMVLQLSLRYHLGLAVNYDKPGRVVTGAVAVIAAWATGRAVRQGRAYAAGVQEQAGRRAREQLTQERLRIARELHDVIAHGLSLIAVQASVANYVADQRPQEAARVLSSIENTSRTALAEMRRLLGVLRDGDGARHDTQLAPTPGLADLRQLAARTTGAGVRVDLEIRGQPRDLPAGISLAAYRIIQEALTNVVSHARTATSRVIVCYEPDALQVIVTDPGQGGPPLADGHGITGMRERVGLYGGDFQAGPLPRGGFRVSARLPVEPSP